MLYTANVSAIKRIKRKVKVYYILRNHGNDVVVPDQLDLDHYKSQALTWEGFRVNYLARLMRPEADEWMRRVSEEAVPNDVVLADEEADAKYSYRKLLAEMMVNMFSGRLKLLYAGELTD